MPKKVRKSLSLTLLVVASLVLGACMPTISTPPAVPITDIFSCENSLKYFDYAITATHSDLTGFEQMKCDQETGMIVVKAKMKREFVFHVTPWNQAWSVLGYPYTCENGICTVEDGLQVGIAILSLDKFKNEVKEPLPATGPLSSVELPSTPTGAMIVRIRGNLDKSEIIDGQTFCNSATLTWSTIHAYYETGSAMIMGHATQISWRILGGSLSPLASNKTLVLIGQAWDEVSQSEMATQAVVCYNGEQVGLEVSFR